MATVFQKAGARPSARTGREAAQVEQIQRTGDNGAKVKAELDDLLDEIDSVLEDQAEEFVRSYIQKGGQ